MISTNALPSHTNVLPSGSRDAYAVLDDERLDPMCAGERGRFPADTVRPVLGHIKITSKLPCLNCVSSGVDYDFRRRTRTRISLGGIPPSRSSRFLERPITSRNLRLALRLRLSSSPASMA